MILRLSPTEIDRLEAALEALHTPFDHPHVDAWRHEVNRRVRTLLGAHKVVFMMPGPGHEPVYSQHLDPAALPPYGEHYHRLDPGPRLGLLRGGAPGTLEEMVGREALRSSEFFNDYLMVWSCHHTLGMAVPLETTPPFAFLSVQRDSERHPPFGPRGKQVMRLLWPALKAGVRAYVRLAEHRESLGAVLDRLGERLLLADARGRTVHVNAALRRALAADPEAERLTRAMRNLARRVGPAAGNGGGTGPGRRSGEHTLETDRGAYRIFAHRTESWSPGALVLVHLEPLFGEPLSDAVIVERYRLTPRETQVARLLAAGRSNASVASDLAISPHTTRRHTERVLAKLAVDSRAQVADSLLRR